MTLSREEQARRLLEWWDGTNALDDRETQLAVDTRAFLAGEDVDLPSVAEMHAEAKAKREQGRQDV